MRIIYISGIDGCGKTTQAELLAAALKQEGVDATYMWLRWEPTFQKITHIIRSIVSSVRQPSGQEKKGYVTGEALDKNESVWVVFKRRMLSNFIVCKVWLLFAGCDYFLGYKKRMKNLGSDVIVMDRYVHDFMIDQSVNSGVLPENMDQFLNRGFVNKFQFPDYTIIIDLPPEVGSLRKLDGTTVNYLKMREPYYLSFQGPDTLHLNGLKSVADLHDQIKDWVFKKLELDKT